MRSSRPQLNLSDADLLEMQREICRRSMADFVRLAWPHIIPGRLVWGWHMDAICEHLEAVCHGHINRLLINIPPGSSKSTLAGVMLPAWQWGPGARAVSKFIGASHSQDLAIRDNRMTRELVRSSWYQSLWPLAFSGDQNEKLYFENSKKGFRQACAVASMTGRRGDFIIWDDPLSPEKAHSEAHRDVALRVFSETLPTRLNNPENSSIIVIMQRLHEDDPSGHIIRSDLGYEQLVIPMEYEAGPRRFTSIGWSDPREEPGESIDPERFPAHIISRDKAAMGSYAWAGQMQQRPAPSGGGIFRDDWWRYYSSPPVIRWRSIYADTAQKTGEQNDYSVFQCWGASAEGHAVLLDQIRGRWEAPELQRMASSFWAKHKSAPGLGELRAMKIEDKASGTGLIQALRKGLRPIPVSAIPRSTDKVSRAHDAAPLIESGRVMIPDSASWLSDYLSEFRSFPNGSHDDQIDPTMDAISDILSRNSYSLANVR